MKNTFVTPWSSRLVAACAIGLAVWALRVALVGDLGTGIPFWDQWDREGLIIYEPWIKGQLTWQAIFEPHVEHRIVWTHLWNLGLFALCDQWDPMVQMVAQTIISALTAGFFVWCLVAVHSGLFWRMLVLVGALVAFGSPYVYANTLWGFQSSFSLFVVWSIGGCASAAWAWTHGRYVWLALLTALAAPFAMGAGALAGPVIISLTVLVVLVERRLSRRSGVMLAVGLICFLWGILWRSNSTVMLFAHAESILSFLKICLAALAWPNCQLPWLAGLSCLPVVLMMIRLVRKKAPPRPHELFIIGIAIWAVGCAAGGAWTRGGVDRLPPSRYYDFLTLLCLVNLFALVLVVRAWWHEEAACWRISGAVIAIAWVGVTLFGGVDILANFFQAQRPEIMAKAGRQFESVNSVLGGAPLAVMIGAGLQNQPLVLERVMHSQVLAPHLPPELQLPPQNITAVRVLAIGLDGPHAHWQWISGEFEVRLPAMIVFVRGDASQLKLALLNPGSESKNYFMPSGRHIGAWSEWLVQTPSGPHRMSIEAPSSPDELAIMLPRPLSTFGYWARRGAAQSGLLYVLAAIGVGAALFASFRATAGQEKTAPNQA